MEQSQISCCCKQCFGASGDSETLEGLGWHRPRVPAYQEPSALGIAFADRYGSEDRMRDCLWEPPAPNLGGGERCEGGTLREYELPTTKHGAQRAGTGDVKPSGELLPLASSTPASERFRRRGRIACCHAWSIRTRAVHRSAATKSVDEHQVQREPVEKCGRVAKFPRGNASLASFFCA